MAERDVVRCGAAAAAAGLLNAAVVVSLGDAEMQSASDLDRKCTLRATVRARRDYEIVNQRLRRASASLPLQRASSLYFFFNSLEDHRYGLIN